MVEVTDNCRLSRQLKRRHYTVVPSNPPQDRAKERHISRESELPGEICMTASLINSINNSGPSTDTRGTPDRTGKTGKTEKTEDCSPPTATICVLWVK